MSIQSKALEKKKNLWKKIEQIKPAEGFSLEHLLGDEERKIIKKIADDCRDEILSDFDGK
jgi:hypothetical protein